MMYSLCRRGGCRDFSTSHSCRALRPLIVAVSVWLIGLASWATSRPAAANDDDRLVVTHAGDPFQGHLLTIDSRWQLEFQTNDDTVRLPADSLAYWGQWQDVAEHAQAVLVDGTRLAGDLEHIEQETIRLRTRIWGPLEIPRELVRGLLAQPTLEFREFDRLLNRVESARGIDDRLILVGGDELVGRIIPSADNGLDLFGPADAQIEIAGGGMRTVPTNNLAAIIFSPAMANTSSARTAAAHLGFRDGSRLAVQLATTGEQATDLHLACGLKLQLSNPEWLRSVCWVQPFGEHVRYLSDSEPLDYRHRPFLGRTYPLARNHNVLTGQLRSHSATYAKGIGMPSTSRAVFELTSVDRRFQSELAIDREAGLRGSVVFHVFLLHQQTGNESWQAAYKSPPIRGGDALLSVDIDVTDANQIALFVEYADRGDVCDYANWLNARLVQDVQP